ncbi:hypothetical protein [Actinoplanes couchii]|uniref:Uncharacterized protein n=1 Tax=Actinoplanes couchii TaxID=403638 RepID=A0ABQ3XN67_9ACTN|nr:hypothetical protein [Actinoplanes couchii]MDR6317926.1 hypothetical protein [Actinoplanes couchii]GID59913.1 hypothetical protein Aco03nite_083170 [Actinoplanes couchii]
MASSWTGSSSTPEPSNQACTRPIPGTASGAGSKHLRRHLLGTDISDDTDASPDRARDGENRCAGVRGRARDDPEDTAEVFVGNLWQYRPTESGALIGEPKYFRFTVNRGLSADVGEDDPADGMRCGWQEEAGVDHAESNRHIRR